MNRRGFLKLLGGTVVAAIVAPAVPKIATPTNAPLFVPSQHLDFGVPTQRLVTAREAASANMAHLWEQRVSAYAAQRAVDGQHRTIPMLLIQDEYLPQYGGKLKAGAQVMVDRVTAERWTENRIAAPGSGAPRDLQDIAAKAAAEREIWQHDRWTRPVPQPHDDHDVLLTWEGFAASAIGTGADALRRSSRDASKALTSPYEPLRRGKNESDASAMLRRMLRA